MKDKDKIVLKNCPFTEEQVIQILKDIRDHPDEYKKLVELKKEMIKEWREETMEKNASNERHDPTVYEVWLTIPTKIRESFLRFLAGEGPLYMSHIEKLNTDQQKVFYYYTGLIRTKKVLFELRECFSELVGEYTTQEIYDEIDHKLKELEDELGDN